MFPLWCCQLNLNFFVSGLLEQALVWWINNAPVHNLDEHGSENIRSIRSHSLSRILSFHLSWLQGRDEIIVREHLKTGYWVLPLSLTATIASSNWKNQNIRHVITPYSLYAIKDITYSDKYWNSCFLHNSYILTSERLPAHQDISLAVVQIKKQVPACQVLQL